MRLALHLTLFAALAACTQFPELDSALTPGAETAPYPDLLPVETLNIRVPEPLITEAAPDSLAARVARLRARAARLRGSVLDSGTRARMQAGVGDI